MVTPGSDARPLRVDDLHITLPDGCRLFARVWRPETGPATPAILEATPYGVTINDLRTDDPRNRYIAERGYACVRIDLRGSGNSEGEPLDEYVAQEQGDLVAVVAWIAAQPWCDGAVGMIGVSWGGFNVLQTAARRPPALRAVVSVCASGDRYAHDVHYLGGCVLANEALGWSTDMLLVQSRPPDPLYAGEGWLDLWRARLEKLENLLSIWLAHQRRDDYWQHGSVCDDPEAIACPVLVVGGWADGYVSGTLDLVGRLDRVWGLVGPWTHGYPHINTPDPTIAFLDEQLRFWDRWLKKRNTNAET